MNYGRAKKVSTDFDGAVAAVTAALREQGFGVLTEIDVRATLKKKLGLDFRPYKILGACNPVLASQALAVEPEIGLLLPCNIVVQETAEGVTVSIADPKLMSRMAGNPGLDAVAEEADRRLDRVIDMLP